MKGDCNKKSALGVASENRKIRKPLMEKKRRARINDSLETLKQILLESKTTLKASTTSSKKNGQRTTKLEKADILEMTVHYIQQLRSKIGHISNHHLDEESDRIKEEIQIRPADSSCDIKYRVALVPARLTNGTIAFVVPTSSIEDQRHHIKGSHCINDVEDGQGVWRPW